MFVEQLRTALIAAWLAVAAILAPVLIAPFVLPADTIFAAVPVCEARAAGHECSFCGMTTAFVMIGHGLLDDAYEANHASLPLFSVLVWNELVALWFVATVSTRLLPRQPIRIVIRTREEAAPETACAGAIPAPANKEESCRS
ncbi:MAG TPA: DUF2752 domain-containing protein [Bryobacteraceae bacterium]|nr:DUF2752 domain-containing protein [Bryobacteraceae bacterium]